MAGRLIYMTSVELTVTTARSITFTERLEMQIATIIGLSAQVDGVNAANTALITLSNSSDLYLTLKRGTSALINKLRLSDLVYLPDPDGTGALPFPDKRYLPILLPGDIAMDKSFVENPTGIAAGVVLLNVFYLPK